MPGEGGEDDQSEDDQDFAGGAFHGCADRAVRA
jgi:hypothetical protein